MVETDISILKQKYDISQSHTEEPIAIPSDISQKSGIILLVGSSGSGKSTILKSLGMNSFILDESRSAIDHFRTADDAETYLLSMGLRSIPTWFRPLNTLSMGEKHRAECAIYMYNNYMYIDEFTSVVDRDTAKSLSASFKKYFPKDKTVYIASCHRDIIEWLQPDHIYDTDSQKYIQKDSLCRPKLSIEIIPASVEDWVYFKKHHYLSGDISKSAHCYKALYEGKPIAFLAVIHSTGRDIRSYWREHRLVVLPEFQGLGIGTAFSDTMAKEYTSRGLRYFSKTAHVAMGEHRENNPNWRPTSTNKVIRKSYMDKDGKPRKQNGFGKSLDQITRDSMRACYSHEYIG